MSTPDHFLNETPGSWSLCWSASPLKRYCDVCFVFLREDEGENVMLEVVKSREPSEGVYPITLGLDEI